MTSSKYRLDVNDLKKWGYNTLVFLAPAMVVFLTAIQSGKSAEESAYVLYLWGLNTAIDLLKKFVKENK